MNPLIKLLAEQATTYIEPTATSGEGWIFDKEKFAELIVQECANYIKERTLDWDADLRWIFNDGSGYMAVDVDDLLNRHFGVEE
jgi:hypothetical protein